MKEISAALLLETPMGYLFCHPTKRNFDFGTYDLPKGHIEENETPYDAMVRELYEETGINFESQVKPFLYDFKDLGIQQYNKKKNIYLFYVKIGLVFPITSLKCTSYFTDSYGKEVPEHNGFLYSNTFSPLFPNLKKMLEKVIYE